MVKPVYGKTKLPKFVEKTTAGSCPYCHKHVKALEAHIRVKHKKERLPRK